jgi:ABC-type glycerol-3-phosphate transport system substrate-binding protein
MIVRRRTRRFVSAIAAAAAAVSVCVAPIGAHQSRATHTPVTLTWYMWSASQTEVAAWQWDAAHVTKVYPWIHVKFVTDTFPNYWTKLSSEAATGGLQDIISLQMQRTPGFTADYVPLNSMVKSNNFDIKSYDKGIVQALSYAGNLDALPYDFGPIVVYYNKDLFDKYKVPYPSFKWSYAEFKKDVLAISHPGDQIFGINANPVIDTWLPFALSAGAHYLTKDGKLNLTDPALASAFQNYAELDYKYGASPAQSIPLENYAYAQFQSGNIGTFLDGPWDMINLKNSVKFKMGIATIPAINGHSISQTAGSGFGIAKTAKDPQDAWLAITALTDPAAEQYLATVGRAYPGRIAQQKYWFANAVPGAQKVLTYQENSSVPFLTTPNWNQVETLSQNYLTTIVNEGGSASKALATIQQLSTNNQ